MIVGIVSDPRLRSVVARAALPEEDVVFDPRLAREALAFGTVRALVVDDGAPAPPRAVSRSGIPVVPIRGASTTPRPADPLDPDAVLAALRSDLEELGNRPAWVDRALSELGRAAGGGLPPELRGFGRRVMEFPSHYSDLHAVARGCGTTRGALKARFRRRGLPSPYVYLRWFRVLATAHILGDPDVTVSRAARRVGFTSGGNLCRFLTRTAATTPTALRGATGWSRAIVAFASRHLTADDLARWADLDELFRRVA